MNAMILKVIIRDCLPLSSDVLSSLPIQARHNNLVKSNKIKSLFFKFETLLLFLFCLPCFSTERQKGSLEQS